WQRLRASRGFHGSHIHESGGGLPLLRSLDRRRFPGRHHATVHDRLGRTRLCRSRGSGEAFAHRLYRHLMDYGSLHHLPGIASTHVSLHRTGIHECVARNHRHAVGDPLIRISDSLLAVVVLVDVVNVCHLGDVDARVRHVHVLHVALTYAIGRHIHFSRSQRKPAHAISVAGCASHKGDESGRIHRTRHDGARHPAPPVTRIGPAAIVEGGEAPRLVIHPGPAPRTDVGPVAVAIRSPVGGYARGIPNVAVVGYVGPASVIIEIFVPSHLRRDV